MKSVELLKKVMIQKDWSRYRLAKELNVSPQAIYKLLDGYGVMSDYIASQVAEILDIPEFEVISLCNYERALKVSEKDYWKKKLQVLVATVILGLTTLTCNIGSNSADLDDQKSTKSLISTVNVLFLILLYIRITYIMLN